MCRIRISCSFLLCFRSVDLVFELKRDSIPSALAADVTHCLEQSAHLKASIDT